MKIKGAALIAAAALVLAGCEAEDDSASSSEPTAQQETQQPTQAPPAEETSEGDGGGDTATQRAAVAKTVQKKIGGFFPGCDWKPEGGTRGEGVVDQWSCSKHEILLATDNTHSGVKTWMGSMNDDLDAGYGLLGDKYALTTPGQGTANQLWDVLGADDERFDFSD